MALVEKGRAVHHCTACVFTLELSKDMAAMFIACTYRNPLIVSTHSLISQHGVVFSVLNPISHRACQGMACGS